MCSLSNLFIGEIIITVLPEFTCRGVETPARNSWVTDASGLNSSLSESGCARLYHGGDRAGSSCSEPCGIGLGNEFVDAVGVK